MPATPVADFTPLEVNLRLREHSWTPIVFTFTGVDLTGYTAPLLRWATGIDSTPTSIDAEISTTDDTTAVSVTIGSDEWASLAELKGAVYELSATSPTGHEVSLISGWLSVEASLLP